MRRKPAARFDRSGEIVMLFAHVERGMLQNTLDETDLLGSVGGDERGGSSPEVMQTHGFAELGHSAGPDNIVDPACR